MNFPVMKQVVAYTKELNEKTGRKFDFSMTTNGTILNDEIYNFIIDNHVFITLSIDGPQEVHDAYRCRVDGRGSYDAVEKNARRLLESKKVPMMARATVCHPNMHLYDLYHEIELLGFKSIVLSPVDARNGSPLYITENDLNIMFDETDKLLNEYMEAVTNHKPFYYRSFEVTLNNIYTKDFRLYGCGAAKGMISVGTNGSIYPCQRFMGDAGFVLGNVSEGFSGEKRKEFLHNDIFSNTDCADCWMRFACGGGCLHMNLKANGGIAIPTEHMCKLSKRIFKLMLYIYWKLKQNNDNIFLERFRKVEVNDTSDIKEFL